MNGGSMSSRDQVLAPQAVADLIAQGQTIVIMDDMILRLDSWLEKHPGGRLAILHMVGKDATDEIMAYHRAPTVKMMKAFRIGRKPMGPWINMTPPIRGGIYHHSGEAAAQSDCCIINNDSNNGTSGCDANANVTANADAGASGYSTPQLMPCVQRRGPPSSNGRSSPTSIAITVDDDITDDDILIDCEKTAQLSSSRGLGSKGQNPMTREEYATWAVKQGAYQSLAEFPPLDQDVQLDIVNKYRVMHQRIIDEGLYECRYLEYGKEMVRYTLLFALFVVTLRYGWYAVSAAFLGAFWHQIMFTAHDAGHRAITQNFVIDTLIGVFIADFCCGLSIGWWKSSHNVHHLITNHPEHDPDIQNLPLFATCPSFFKSIASTYYDGFVFAWDAAADFLIPYQQYTYYPVMAIARFNLYVLSWLHVLSSKSSGLGSSKAWWIRPTEIAGMTCYWFLFGYCLLWCSIPTWTSRVIFVLISHIALMPLHVQINLSHWGMSTADLGDSESFPQRQLRTTMDVDCPIWLDWFHGGLQFQAVHHLFPRLPRHNLRRAQAMVKEFSQQTTVPYSIMGFVDGNRKVLGRLGEVSEQVKILVRCQTYMAETGEMGFL